MSRKSNAVAQQNKELRGRVESLHRKVTAMQNLRIKMDQAAESILTIVKVYGRHLAACPKSTDATTSCTCEWDQAEALLGLKQTAEAAEQGTETQGTTQAVVAVGEAVEPPAVALP